MNQIATPGQGGGTSDLRSSRVWRWLVVPALMLAPALVAAHELEEASATLTVRSGGHVELRLQVPWANLLQATVAPRRPLTELLGQLASEPAATFARRHAALIGRLSAETRLLAPSGAVPPFTRWQWPSAAAVQQALREELMSRMVDGAAFRHASRLAATAEVTVPVSASSVRLGLPSLLGPALVTVLRPEEQWVGRGQLSRPFVLRGEPETRH